MTDAVNKSLNSPLTLVAQGGQVDTIGSYDKVAKLFNWYIMYEINLLAKIILTYKLNNKYKTYLHKL